MSNARAIPGIVLATAVLAAATGVCWAQSTSASLSGVVRTASGEAVADAVVQARSESTGMVRTAVSDADGHYAFQIPPGTWTLVARDLDGVPSEVRTVKVGLQQSARVDFSLGTGVTERVRVVADRPLVDEQQVGGELRVDGGAAETLPINGRVVTDLALLDSSVQTATAGNFVGERGSVFVVNGQTGRSNSFLVDGLDNNDQTSGTTLNAFFSQQVIREFVVMTHQYAPEFGRATGGVLNIVTERGGNEPFAEAFIQGTRSEWNSPGSFVSSLPASEGVSDTVARGQAGFKMGGPLRRNRAFYFLAYERQQADEVVTFTGVDRRGVAGGWTVAPGRDDNLFLRTDFNLDDRNFLMVRLSGDDRTTRGVGVGGVLTPEAGFRVEERDVQLAAALTTVVTPELMNEARVLVGTSSFNQFANSGRPGASRPSGVFGGNSLNRQLRDEDRIQLVDNLTWRRKRHTLKFGLDVTRSRTSIEARFNPNGNVLYNTDAPFEPGDGWGGSLNETCVFASSDDTVPCPGEAGVDDDGDGRIDEDAVRPSYPQVYTLIEGAPSAVLEDTSVALFAQDSWQVGPRLLLNYGLRYDLSTFTLPKGARVDSIIPNGGAGRDWNNLAPRLGFTFLPTRDRKFVIRGGAGIFYDKLVLAFPGVAAITSGTEINLVPAGAIGWEITEDFIEDPEQGVEEVRELFDAFNQLLGPLILRFSTGTRLDTPYAVQLNVGVESSLGSHGAWRANVIRSRTYHQPLMRDLNPVVDFIATREGDPESPKIPIHRDSQLLDLDCDGNPCTGSVASVVTEGRTWYTGAELGYRWQGPEGWFSASYTWSKTENLGPDPLKGGIYLPPNAFVDGLNLGAPRSDDPGSERGRSDHDRRHRLVIAGETPPLWMGIRASAVVQLASGAPFNVTTGRDDNGDGITTDRPRGVGRNTGEDTPLDPVNELRAEETDERRELCADGQLAWCDLPELLPVGGLREPNFAQVDVRLSRAFRFRDGTSGELFLQVFNVFDRYNGGPVEGRVISPNFGRPIGRVGPPRILEAGLRLRL